VNVAERRGRTVVGEPDAEPGELGNLERRLEPVRERGDDIVRPPDATLRVHKHADEESLRNDSKVHDERPQIERR